MSGVSVLNLDLSWEITCKHRQVLAEKIVVGFFFHLPMTWAAALENENELEFAKHVGFIFDLTDTCCMDHAS